MLRLCAFWLPVVVGLVGCGESVSEHSTDSEAVLRPAEASLMTPATDTHANGSRLIYGNATKGPLINATVELFELDADGMAQGGALAMTQTDAAGNWQLSVSQTESVLVRISGGSYVDEADTNVNSRRIIELSADQYLESVLLPGQTTVAVTVFTQALIEKSRRETGQSNFAEVIINNRQLFSEAYGFDVLSVLPADPLAPSGSPESIAYAMSVGGVANAINALSIASNHALPEYQHIIEVVRDLVDCRLDGLGTGAQSVVNPFLSGYRDLTLEQQIVRFRNNNFAAYEGFSPATVIASRCDELGGIADTLAPLIVSRADDVFFEALSPAGVVLTDGQVQQLRDQFVASDDRRGELEWTIEIPQQLPIGATPLGASVKDAWGNRTDTEWDVVVADTTPPEVEGLEPLLANAQGDITVVELQRPDVSDRVSSQDQIIITNDAPAGFPVGQTLVIWTVQDEAGNTASFTQPVTVNSVSPEVLPAPAVFNFDIQVIDFSQYFIDPDGTTLTFSIEGLPAGTGLAIDPATGILSGTPAPADIAAQSIALIIWATDGQSSVGLQTSLTVVAPNTPPVFSLSASSLNLDEDFAVQTLTIQPQDVPPAEAGQDVSYAIVFATQDAEDAAPFEVLLDADTLAVQLVPRADAFGTATFIVAANDGQPEQGEFVQTVTVEVNPVNDAPRLVGTDEPLVLVAGESFTFDLNTRASDVDDVELVYLASRLPSAMSITSQGQLLGMALPTEALSEEIPLTLTARDSSNESVEFIVTLQVSNPDSDGDGLSDYSEQLLGFNALLADSDGDGFGDSLEARTNIDTVNTHVIYVGANGNDSQSGDSPETALATLMEASARLDLLGAEQPAVVLIEQIQRLQGGLVLSGNNRTAIGSVDFATHQSVLSDTTPLPPVTTLSSEDSRALIIADCQSCAVFDLGIDGGRGLQVSNSQAVLKNIHVTRTVAIDGAALWVEQSDVVASNLHFAANRAQRGGAVYIGADSQFDIRDSILTGNLASQAGGALLVQAGNLAVHNTILSANTAPIAAAIDAIAASINISSSTIAYHQVKSPDDHNLFRCRDAFLAQCTSTASINMRDSVLVGNRNSRNQPVDLADTHPSGQGNLVEPGRSAGTEANELATSQPFATGYLSDDAMVLNAGSESAVNAGLDSFFSEVASPFTDSEEVEPGVHSPIPLSPITAYQPVAQYTAERALFNLRAVDITLTAMNQSIDGVRRVSVEVSSPDPHAIAVSPGIVPGAARSAASAISLGDGRFRVWLSNAFRAGRDLLLIKLDDDESGIQVSPVCDLALCGLIDLTVVATHHTGRDNEAIFISSEHDHREIDDAITPERPD